MIGRTISHYRILSQIGEGGMGVVYKAEDTKLKRTVALKFLPPHAVGEGEQRARFQREAQAAAALNHPNVCTIYEVDDSGGQPFIAMEFVEGETLAAKIESGPLKIDDALDIAVRLVRVTLNDGQMRTLTSPDSESIAGVSPVLSPDGRVLAFLRIRPNIRLFTVVLGPKGTPVDEPLPAGLDHQEGREVCPTWAPSGKEILFASALAGGSVPVGLWRVTTGQTAQPMQIEALGPSASCAAAFPDGRRLVYTQMNTDRNIWRIELSPDGRKAGRERRVLSSTLYDANPQFSPDGRQIVFETDRTGTKGIWLAEADGSNQRPLFVDEARPAGSPRWSPDSRRVVFDANTDGQAEIFMINAAGGPPLRLTNDPANDIMGVWSADGQWVYFRSMRTGRGEIWKISAAGGEPQQVTRNGGGQMIESLDGKWLYFTNGFAENRELWRLASDGGEPERVADRVRGRSFTVTQRGVYFMRREAEGDDLSYSIYFLDSSTGAESIVATLPAGVRPWVGMTVSPGGRTLLYDRWDQSGSDLMLVENFQ